MGVLCSRARVFGPNSCVLTTEYVVCTSFPARFVLINVYSILPESFGECLCSFTPDQGLFTLCYLAVPHPIGLNMFMIAMEPLLDYGMHTCTMV